MLCIQMQRFQSYMVNYRFSSRSGLMPADYYRRLNVPLFRAVRRVLERMEPFCKRRILLKLPRV